MRDIEEALSFRPDRDMRSSILQTHKLCLSEMRRATRSQSPRRCPNVAHLPHQSIANASDLIKMNYTTEKGRYLEVGPDNIMVLLNDYNDVCVALVWSVHGVYI